jgi:hypothetical protein
MTRINPPGEQDTEFWDEVRQRLLEEADRGYAEAWQPEQEGDYIVGTMVHVTASAPTQYGPAPVVELRDPVGVATSVWLFPKVLRLAFERQRPALGERLLIRFEGVRYPEGGGNAYKVYTLVVDRPTPEGEIDWDQLADRYGDDLDEAAPAKREPGTPHTPDDAVPEDDIPF